jgi:hypothetical protein
MAARNVWITSDFVPVKPAFQRRIDRWVERGQQLSICS